MSQQFQNLYSSDESQKQREFSSSEAQKERDFSAEQSEKDFEREKEMAEFKKNLYDDSSSGGSYYSSGGGYYGGKSYSKNYNSSGKYSRSSGSANYGISSSLADYFNTVATKGDYTEASMTKWLEYLQDNPNISVSQAGSWLLKNGVSASTGKKSSTTSKKSNTTSSMDMYINSGGSKKHDSASSYTPTAKLKNTILSNPINLAVYNAGKNAGSALNKLFNNVKIPNKNKLPVKSNK